jgi:diguanylate cyclase (GGDEF)-like protein
MQKSLVFLSTGRYPTLANREFFHFFNYNNLEDFKKHHSCIHEKFLKDKKFFYFEDDGENSWIDEIMKLSPSKRIVSMLDTTSVPHAFTVSIRKFDDKNFIIDFTDISSTMQVHFELEEKASRDALTGIFNRTYFAAAIDRIRENILLQNKHLGIIMLDIDLFKQVNDTHGHSVGDEVLKSFSKLIQSSIRSSDTLLRWGGEEFLILLSVNTIKDTLNIAEQIRKKIESYDFKGVGKLTCSMGCTLYIDQEDIKTAIDRADKALYIAKESGRNSVVDI